MARKRMCHKCRKEIKNQEDGQRLKINFDIEHGGLEWFCNDCAKDYKEEDYYEEEVFQDVIEPQEELDLTTSTTNQDECINNFIVKFSELVGEDISTNKIFISQINKYLEEKMKQGYISPKLLLDLLEEAMKDDAILQGTEGLKHKINRVFYKMNSVSPGVIDFVRTNISYGNIDKNEFEYFSNEPFKLDCKPSKKANKANTSNKEEDKPQGANKKDDEFPILLPTDDKTLSDKGIAYRMYAHQQTISNKNPNEIHRYVKKEKVDMNINNYCEDLQISDKTYKRHLNKLIKDKMVGKKILNGEQYYLLPHISDLDIELRYVEIQATILRKLVNACSDNALKIYVLIKAYTKTKGTCRLSASKFLEKLGMNTNSGKNRQMVYDCLDILTRKDKNGKSFVELLGKETVYMDDGQAQVINVYKA